MIVYKITNTLNGKIYIGQTKQKIEKRFLQHSKADSPLGQAIRQCGIENSTIEVIEECKNQNELNEREIFWIKVLKSKIPYGYNRTNGGGGFKKYSQKVLPKEICLTHSEKQEFLENIFKKTFLAKNYSIQNCKGISEANLIDIEFDMIIKTNAFGGENDLWRIKILEEDIYDSVAKMLEKFFSRLYIRKNIKTKLRLSIVTFNEVAFKVAKKQYSTAMVSDYISVILLDQKFQKVTDEFILTPRNEKQKIESVLL